MKIVYMGTPRAAATSLECLVSEGHEIVAVYTQPDRPAGRGNKIAQSPVKEFAVANGLAIYQPTKIKTEEAWDEFRSHGAEVAVVVAYGRILPGRFLTVFPGGAINVHFSLLPKYRGAAPVNWAIVHGEKTTGVTTMHMDAGLDTGPILMQCVTEIGDDETAIELLERLSALGADLLIETLDSIEKLTPRSQDEVEATFAPLLKKEDGLISWMLDAPEIAHRVRGFQPFPTACSFFRGKKLTVWKSTPVAVEHNATTPGALLSASGDSLVVFCGGDSMLRLDEVQLEGKRRVSARDFINGVRPEIGEVFGKLMEKEFQIITFYEFKAFDASELPNVRASLRDVMRRHSIKGTVILAEEGFNSTVCGEPDAIKRFLVEAEAILATHLRYKSSFHDACPFRRIDVKVKPEIVTLKKNVDISLGKGTHVGADEWNQLIKDPSVVVLDTRNDYEFRNGSFRRALNPQTEKFSDLPAFVDENLDPEKHPRVAMFCTGGIRCEKFAPYLKQIGFKEVFQLEGGILRYLETVDESESLWRGECFVFDDRRTVDENLEKGVGPDYSQK